MDKIIVFVDGNNFYRGCKDNLGRVDVDIAKLGHVLAGILSGSLIRTYYYNAWISDRFDPIGHEKQRKFFESLERAPQVTVKFGRLIYHPVREGGLEGRYFPTEKGIDVQIAVDMIRIGLLKACDTAVLVSGDSDFIHAISFVKDLGINVCVANFQKGASRELLSQADQRILLSEELLSSCFIRQDNFVESYEPPVFGTDDEEEEKPPIRLDDEDEEL
ncbi:hypothetical protein AMJ86_03190 [bacterium SM23_57]|nr:MAG: hypothetical protein AMJ86_03190 [bacterium SM23_57]